LVQISKIKLSKMKAQALDMLTRPSACEQLELHRKTKEIGRQRNREAEPQL